MSIHSGTIEHRGHRTDVDAERPARRAAIHYRWGRYVERSDQSWTQGERSTQQTRGWLPGLPHRALLSIRPSTCREPRKVLVPATALPRRPVSRGAASRNAGKVDYSLLNKVSIDASWELQSPGIRLIEIGGQPFQLVDADHRGRPELHRLPIVRIQCAMLSSGWLSNTVALLDVLSDRLIAATLLQLDTEHFYLFSWSHHLVLTVTGAW